MKTLATCAAFFLLFTCLLFTGDWPGRDSHWLAWAGMLLKDSVAVLCLSLSGYALKRRWRLIYGIGELLIFIPSAMAFILGLVQSELKPAEWTNWSSSMLIVAGLVTVTFAGVRAIEDIGEGLRGQVKQRWDSIFPKPIGTA